MKIYTQEGTITGGTIEVNRPMEIEGWKIYQLSYDETKGRWSDISVFELVRDPWLPVVYTGIIMMMAGASVCLSAHKRGKRRTRNELEHFIWFAIAALICWSLGAFAAWKGKKPVWTYGFTLLGLVIFFQFYPRYVDFSGTSSDADDGRDTSVVFFLPSIGWFDNVRALEI